MAQTRQLAAIMFTDIVGYTALMGADEQKAFQILTKNRDLQKPVISQFNGRCIKELGDGLMASFSSVSDAVQAAIKIQEDCHRIGAFSLRIGIHHGEVVFEDSDIFGDAVNIASRLQAIAPVGGIWISESVHQNVANKKDIKTTFVKEEKLKNVKMPVRIYSVILDNIPGSSQPKTNNTIQAASVFVKKKMKWLPMILLLTAVAVLFFAFFVYNKNRESTNAIAGASLGNSIAVLPFMNMSNDKEQEYFSDGLSEELLNLLARIPELKVIARTSSFAFKGKNEDARSISEKLGVAHLLEGSVRKAGNQLRITAQLIKASDGSQLWSETYDRKMDDIFKLQNEIATAVVRELKVKLIPTTAPSRNPEVLNLILQGNYFLDKLDKDNVAKAMNFYKQALAIDSTDARAWAMLATTYSRSAWQNYIDQTEGYENARQTALKAIALDPSTTQGLLALGGVKMYHDFDWKGAKEIFDKVLLLEPGNALAWNNLACLNQILGNWDKAVETMKPALVLDPLKPIFYSNQGANYTYAKKLDEANAMYKKVLEINPQFQRAHMYLGRNYLLQGKPELALAEMQKETVEPFKHFGLVLAYHGLNNKSRADQVMASFTQEYGANWPYLIAELFAFRGEKENAITWLEKAYEQKDSWLVWIKGDLLLKNIWNDTRYISILKKLNLYTD